MAGSNERVEACSSNRRVKYNRKLVKTRTRFNSHLTGAPTLESGNRVRRLPEFSRRRGLNGKKRGGGRKGRKEETEKKTFGTEGK